MKNIIKMSSLDELLDTSNLPKPCVASFKDGEDEYILYRDLNGNDDFFKNGEKFDPLGMRYLWVESLEDGNVVRINDYYISSYKSSEIRYSFDCIEWYEGDCTLNKGQRAYFRAKRKGHSKDEYLTFKFSKKVNVGGNVMSMDDWIYNQYGFNWFFYNCTTLVSAKDLMMPTEMRSNMCDSMFYGCSSLVDAPKLPATRMQSWCYNKMFMNCVSLVNAPELPATELADVCYQCMFKGCQNLVKAPELNATQAKNACYLEMFTGCSKLSYVKMLLQDNNASTIDWLYQCASQGTVVLNINCTFSKSSAVPSGWDVKYSLPESDFEDVGISSCNVKFVHDTMHGIDGHYSISYDQCDINIFPTQEQIEKILSHYEFYEVQGGSTTYYKIKHKSTGKIVELVGKEDGIELVYRTHDDTLACLRYNLYTDYGKITNGTTTIGTCLILVKSK